MHPTPLSGKTIDSIAHCMGDGRADGLITLALLFAARCRVEDQPRRADIWIYSSGNHLYADWLPEGYPRSALLYVLAPKGWPSNEKIGMLQVVDPSARRLAWYCQPEMEIND